MCGTAWLLARVALMRSLLGLRHQRKHSGRMFLIGCGREKCDVEDGERDNYDTNVQSIMTNVHAFSIYADG